MNTLALLLAVLLPALRPADVRPWMPTTTITTGTARTLSISGTTGGQITSRMPGTNAIFWGLHLDESADAPCDLDLFWWRADGGALTQGLFKTTFRLCGVQSSSDGFVGVGWHGGALVTDSNGVPTGSPHHLGGSAYLGAHGLRACLNRGGDRVKGVRLFGSTINQDNAREVRRDPALLRDFERTNCNEWKATQMCNSGEVVVGLDIHHTDHEIRGFAPKCASVTVRL
jgi:hypothetical protein